MKDGIVIVDDHDAFRVALREHIKENSEFEVLAEFGDGREFLAARLSERCGVVLLDISMPQMDGITVLGQLRDRHPKLAAIIVSGREEPIYRQSAIAHGALGFVAKDSVYTDLIPCIRKVLAGGRWLPENAVS